MGVVNFKAFLLFALLACASASAATAAQEKKLEILKTPLVFSSVSTSASVDLRFEDYVLPFKLNQTGFTAVDGKPCFEYYVGGDGVLTLHFNPLCQACGSLPLAVFFPESKETLYKVVDVPCEADLLVVAASLGKFDAEYYEALLNYFGKLSLEGVKAKYAELSDYEKPVTPSAFSLSKQFVYLSASYNPMLRSFYESVRKIRSRVQPRYLLIVGSKAEFPMPEYKPGYPESVSVTNSIDSDDLYGLPLNAVYGQVMPADFPVIPVARIPSQELAATVFESFAANTKPFRKPLVVTLNEYKMYRGAYDIFSAYYGGSLAKKAGVILQLPSVFCDAKTTNVATAECVLAPKYCFPHQEKECDAELIKNIFVSRRAIVFQTHGLVDKTSYGRLALGGAATGEHFYPTILNSVDLEDVGVLNGFYDFQSCYTLWLGKIKNPTDLPLVFLEKGAVALTGKTVKSIGVDPLGRNGEKTRLGDALLAAKLKRKAGSSGLDADQARALALYGNPLAELDLRSSA